VIRLAFMETYRALGLSMCPDTWARLPRADASASCMLPSRNDQEEEALMSRVILLIFLILSPAYVYSQPSSITLRYEVVSIHEGGPAPDGSLTISGGMESAHNGRLELTNWGLQSFLSRAFHIQYDHIEGVPDSLRHAIYVIRAQSGEETNAALKSMTDDEAAKAKLAMMQEILRDRFHLRYHIDTREAPSFLLVTGKQPKLRRSTAKPLIDGDERRYNPDDPTQSAARLTCSMHGCALSARGQTIERLAEMIGGQLSGPVVDRTNLAGLWDFELQWSSSYDTSTGQDYPPVEVALAEQLGLKLERGKSPQEFLVVEHVESPTPN